MLRFEGAGFLLLPCDDIPASERYTSITESDPSHEIGSCRAVRPGNRTPVGRVYMGARWHDIM